MRTEDLEGSIILKKKTLTVKVNKGSLVNNESELRSK